MAAVVLDIEANPGRQEAEQHCQQEALPPSLSTKTAAYTTPRNRRGGWPSSSTSASSRVAGGRWFENTPRPAPQLELEGVAVANFSCCRGWVISTDILVTLQRPRLRAVSR